MMPDRLSTQLSVFESLPEDEANNLLLGSCYVRLPINSTPRYTDWHNQMSKQQLLTQQYKECTVAMPTWFMKRSRFEAVGPFIERPAEDLMLFQVSKTPLPSSDPKAPLAKDLVRLHVTGAPQDPRIQNPEPNVLDPTRE